MIRITLGNKAYSSWSLRAWLMLKATGAPFEEIVIPLDRPETADTLKAASPSGLVPVLADGSLQIWESLAIGEYLAERFPAAGLWPADTGRRAIARALAAEMHAGFSALRRHMPMDLKQRRPGYGRAAGVRADVDRITAIWHDRLTAKSDRDGPFLFGRWCLADIMFAPVCTRFRTYAVDLAPACTDYCTAVLAHPDLLGWQKAAEAEPWEIAHDLLPPGQAAW